MVGARVLMTKAVPVTKQVRVPQPLVTAMFMLKPVGIIQAQVLSMEDYLRRKQEQQQQQQQLL